MGLGTLSCAGDHGETSGSTMTTSEASSDAVAITYGGPTLSESTGTTGGDTTTTTDSIRTTTTTDTRTTDGTSTSTRSEDSSNADAVTYGGPGSPSDSDWTASESDRSGRPQSLLLSSLAGPLACGR